MAEKQDSQPSRFRVIIVGGGIGGLALANSLQHAGVDFTLIEKRERLDPASGASIGILPSGARVLDQIGCYEELLEVTASMKTSGSHRADGSLIGDVSDTLQLMQIRTGYAVVFLDRQVLLRILSDRILDRSRIKLETSVASVEQTSEKAVVECSDGTSIEGDVVVGADGTYSFVREEMWRHADQAGQGGMFENDKKSMSAEYMCLFGISSRISGMETGQTDRTYAKDMSTLSYVGKEGRIFWFVFVKMDQVYHQPSIPRYTKDDADALVERIGDLAIRPKSVVTVRHLYDSRLTSHLVAIEEAAYQHWSHGRIVCLGDSIHKMTANLGAGASSALESAAALSNVLVPLSRRGASGRPSLTSLQDAFKQYQAARSLRVGRAMGFSNALTRIQALKGTREYIYTHYIAPRSEDSAAEAFSSFVIGAEKIDHLPVPRRSLEGTMPFNPRQGWGYEERKFDRIWKALPLVGVALVNFGLRLMDFPSSIVTRGSITGSSQTDHPVMTALATAVTAQDILYGIWLLEAIRSINRGTFLQLSTVIGILSLYLRYDILGSLFLFALYTYSPIENFRASDNRLTDMSYTTTAGPLLAVCGILPRMFSQWSPTAEAGTWMIERQPYLIGAMQFLLAHSVIPRTQSHDRLWAVRRDLPWIRYTIGSLVAASVFSRICGLTTFLIERPFVPAVQTTLSISDLAFTISVSIWLLLVLRDFRMAGMSNLEWTRVLPLCIGTSIVLGPGVLLGLGWLWREEILTSRRHKDAAVQVKV